MTKGINHVFNPKWRAAVVACSIVSHHHQAGKGGRRQDDNDDGVWWTSLLWFPKTVGGDDSWSVWIKYVNVLIIQIARWVSGSWGSTPWRGALGWPCAPKQQGSKYREYIQKIILSIEHSTCLTGWASSNSLGSWLWTGFIITSLSYNKVQTKPFS